MSSETDKLRAQLEMAELEEKLVRAKDTKKGPSHDLKMAVREARQRYRELRDGNPDVPASGDAVVNPEPVTGGVEVQP